MAKSLVIVDRRVSDFQELLAGLSENTEIFLLDPDRDGITQIADFLAGRTGFDSIQIISHGRAGALDLGSTILTNDNLITYRDSLARIGQALTGTGDILLYGCNVAQGKTGQDFIAQLASLTGVEVAASTDLTGAANRGGDWVLEASTGAIETAGINAPDYQGLLALNINPSPRSFPNASSGEFLNDAAFAALRGDGSVVTWGGAAYGGDSSSVATALDGTIDVTQVFSTYSAFAALRGDGTVVTWGDAEGGGDSTSVATALDGTIDVTQLFSTQNAFAALRGDGSVVTWGDAAYGGNSSGVAGALDGTIAVTQVFSAIYAFAALRADGSVVTWGNADSGGDSSSVATALDGSNAVTRVFSTYLAFAVLHADGSVVTWGSDSLGGDSSTVAAALDGTIDVTEVFSTGGAFAALRADGSVVTWGSASSSGNSSGVAAALDGTIDVTKVFSTYSAFAALRADGSVVTWGDVGTGGDSATVAAALNGSIDVTQVCSAYSAFAALRADGSVVTWGSAALGGNSTTVAAALNGSIDVTQLFSTRGAFAALRADGSVVTWGGANSGGDSSSVAPALDGSIDVTQVFSTGYAFAALRADGSVVTWGDAPNGGDSSSVAGQLTNVVSLANPYTNDVYLAPDPTPPTVTDFSPADEAIGVAVGSNIIVTFSEAVQPGSGNILLKTAAGVTVATYDVATSANLTISGNTLTINPSDDLAIGTGYTVEFAAGSVRDLAGDSYAGTTSYNFTTVANINHPGTAGIDTFYGGVNNDLMDGGAGIDNAIFTGNRQSYTIAATGSGCTLSGAGQGSDTLTGIERLHFADVNLAWDIDGSAGQIYRLYQAAFDRIPDLGGLGGWIGGMDGGMTLLQVATGFVDSAEFQSLYGANPSNDQFITQLYLNVLNRAPDAEGLVYWVNQLAGSLQSRAQVLVNFSESPENQAAVLPAIAGGILYADAEQAAGPARGQNFNGTTLVDILIGTVGNDSFFGGAGDDSFDGGVGLDSAIYEGSRASHTITRTSGGLTVSGGSDGTDTLLNVERLKFADSALAFDIDGNAGQTYRLYQAAFARTPDTAGLSDWIRGMDSGMTLQNVATGFIGSAEFQGLYGASPSNTEFIDLLYNNVLHRAPDQAGYDYWIDQINHGMSREQVLVGFSESQENQLALLGVIQDGIEYIPA